MANGRVPEGRSSDGQEPADWIGRERASSDTLTLERARKLAATLDLDPDGLTAGAPLPPGWHWIYFHEPVVRSDLAEDGHERRGSFLPPVPLDRRMWAGGRLRFLRPLRIGERVQRISTIRSVEEKQGRAGPLAFVTVEHRIVGEDGGVALEEEQDLVYLSRTPPGGGSDSGEGRKNRGEGAKNAGDGAMSTGDGSNGAGDGVPAEPRTWTEPFAADEVTLFRFSALTFNGHRIHYDRRYATELEGYPDVVVHGPLLALSLLGAGARWAGAAQGVEPLIGWRFGYRARQPVFCREPVRLAGRALSAEEGGGMELFIRHPDRGTVMDATLTPLSSP